MSHRLVEGIFGSYKQGRINIQKLYSTLKITVKKTVGEKNVQRM